jgi:ubiquinone/menaquinone biosynthesis C-methylase UbiE
LEEGKKGTMERLRPPLQGVWNIVRFNWHFYVLSTMLVLLIFVTTHFLNISYNFFANVIGFFIMIMIVISLLISFYIYDLSDLYKLNWMKKLTVLENGKIININAGFDETSFLLKEKFPCAELIALDFYDPSKHTEISIKRARKAHPSSLNTLQVSTSSLPLQNSYADNIFVILSAHEIRSMAERNTFFQELKRVLKHTGKIVVVEHLRDGQNFLAYNIGFFHFISKSSWYETFKKAGLNVFQEIKITPFITTFILDKNGNKS